MIQGLTLANRPLVLNVDTQEALQQRHVASPIAEWRIAPDAAVSATAQTPARGVQGVSLGYPRRRWIPGAATGVGRVWGGAVVWRVEPAYFRVMGHKVESDYGRQEAAEEEEEGKEARNPGLEAQGRHAQSKGQLGQPVGATASSQASEALARTKRPAPVATTVAPGIFVWQLWSSTASAQP